MTTANNGHNPKPVPLPPKRIPGPRAKIAFAEVQRVLMETRSVTVAAAMLGVSQPYLSRYLNRKCRVAWWESVKKRWRVERMRERGRRQRARQAGRDVYADDWHDGPRAPDVPPGHEGRFIG